MQTLYVDGCLSHIHWQLIGDQVPTPWSIANSLLQYLILSSPVSPIPLSAPPQPPFPVTTKHLIKAFRALSKEPGWLSYLCFTTHQLYRGRVGALWVGKGKTVPKHAKTTKTNINKRRGKKKKEVTWPFLWLSLRGTGDFMRQCMTFFCATSSWGYTSGYLIPVWLESFSQRGSDGLISQAININQSGPARGFAIPRFPVR